MNSILKYGATASVLALVSVSDVSVADEIGGGKTNIDPGATPPETTTESCTSTLECAWQELLDIFEMETE